MSRLRVSLMNPFVWLVLIVLSVAAALLFPQKTASRSGSSRAPATSTTAASTDVPADRVPMRTAN